MQFPFQEVLALEDATQNFEALQAKDILDYASTNFLQLLTAGKLQLALGRSSVTWPGATATSNVTTITHNLGRLPAAVVCLIGQQSDGQGTKAILGRNAGSDTTTQFQVQAFAPTYTPGAGVNAGFDWIAIG